MTPMHPRSLPRRVIAVVAAYALAVQAVMAAFAVIPVRDIAGLCLPAGHAADEGTGQPFVPRTDHAGCAICALSCGAMAPPRRAEPALDGVPAPTIATPLPWHVVLPSAARPRSRPGAARAPPATA